MNEKQIKLMGRIGKLQVEIWEAENKLAHLRNEMKSVCMEWNKEDIAERLTSDE